MLIIIIIISQVHLITLASEPLNHRVRPVMNVGRANVIMVLPLVLVFLQFMVRTRMELSISYWLFEAIHE